MRISSVKPAPWLAENLHHLFSQNCISLTSYAISHSLSQINRIGLWRRYGVACPWTTALCINCRFIWKQVMEIYPQALLTRCAWESHAINCPALVYHSIQEQKCIKWLQKASCYFSLSCIACKMYWPFFCDQLCKLNTSVPHQVCFLLTRSLFCLHKFAFNKYFKSSSSWFETFPIRQADIQCRCLMVRNCSFC